MGEMRLPVMPLRRKPFPGSGSMNGTGKPQPEEKDMQTLPRLTSCMSLVLNPQEALDWK